jgi:hypothetical protein
LRRVDSSPRCLLDPFLFFSLSYRVIGRICYRLSRCERSGKTLGSSSRSKTLAWWSPKIRLHLSLHARIILYFQYCILFWFYTRHWFYLCFLFEC